ncbi:MAG: DUF4405 domain-containing protein [Candidatus Woesearchaeota archaeon]
MNKAKINYFIDVLMIILFLVVALTGIFFFFLGGGGFQGGRNPNFRSSFLGIPRATLREIHNYSGLFFIIMMLVHIILHLDWLFCMSKSLCVKNRTEVKISKKK